MHVLTFPPHCSQEAAIAVGGKSIAGELQVKDDPLGLYRSHTVCRREEQRMLQL